eukprot:Nk52_evm31s2391 gene=Nk52_evmTU31s2391
MNRLSLAQSVNPLLKQLFQRTSSSTRSHVTPRVLSASVFHQYRGINTDSSQLFRGSSSAVQDAHQGERESAPSYTNLSNVAVGERKLITPEHEQFMETCKRFFEKEVLPFHDKWEEEGTCPRELWNKAGDVGLLCVMAPEEYGGMGGDFLLSSLVSEEQMRALVSGPGFMLHSDIALPYIVNHASEELKKKWIPKMVSGEAVAAIAMTEPGAGSDLQGVKTTAIRQGDHYILNGSKTFITNGQMADIVIVVAKTEPKMGAKGTSLFIVESGMEGFARGKNLKKVGLRAQDTSELFFDNVKVPASNMIGEENMGFMYLMSEIAQERHIIAVGAIASMEAVYELTLKYCKERKAFGKDIAKFQTIQHKLAEMKTEILVARTFVDRCTELHLEGCLDFATAAMSKYYVTDLQNKIGDICVQLHGGYGFMWEYPVARHFCDARVQRIYGGTNEIMKELIARTL